jgi:hypothetical protein
MSLVLEALKKLEREKGRGERGFMVMAAAPWPARTARRWPLWVALGVAAGAGAAVVALRSAPPAAPPLEARPAAVVAESVAAPAPARAASRGEPRARAAATDRSTDVPAVRPPPASREGQLRAAAAPAVANVPTTAPADPAHGLRLQAVSERDGRPIAIISDRLVRVGDEFDGVRVLAIRDQEVDVEVRGRRATLRF